MSKWIDSMDFVWTNDTDEDWDAYEPQYGDQDYDYGYAEDGWPIPPPCIVCGVYAGNCTEDHYLEPIEVGEDVLPSEDTYPGKLVPNN